MPRFEVGDEVRLSSAGLDNEGYSSFADKTLVVTHVATKYMPSQEFFAKGKPAGYHPGFDGASGDALYDLETEDGEPVNCSLYGWELGRA